MKFSLAFLFLSFVVHTHAQFEIIWNDPITVAMEMYDNNRPRIAILNENQPIVIWGSNNGGKLYTSIWNGEDFDTPQQVNPEGTQIFTADWAGPELATYSDKAYVVYKLSPEDDFGTYISSLDLLNETWSDSIRVDDANAMQESRFPNISIDENGNVSVIYMKFEGNFLEPRYEVAKADNDLLFGASVNASAIINGEACDCCPAYLISGGSNQALLFRNNDDNIRTIWAALSEDEGQTFPNSLEIDSSEEISAVCVSSGPHAVSSNGSVLATWRSEISDQTRVLYTKFDFENPELQTMQYADISVAPNIRQNYPRIAQSDNFAALVWQQTLITNDEIVISISDAENPLFALMKDTVNVELAGKQINPDIAVSGDVIHVVFQDVPTGTVQYRSGLVQQTTELQSSIENPIVSISPNPYFESINIHIPNQGLHRYEILSLRGELIEYGSISGGNTNLKMPETANGLIVVRIISAGSSQVFKLLKY